MSGPGTEPLERLRALAARDEPGRAFGEAPALLGPLASGAAWTGDLTRAGQILLRLDPGRALKEAAAEGTRLEGITVAVTGHSTLGAVVPPLTAELARHGLVLTPAVSDFDSYVRDLQEPDSDLYQADAELALCVLDPQVVFDEVPQPWRVEDVERVTTAKLAQLDGLAASYARHGGGTLVLNTVPLWPVHARQLIDLSSRARLGIVWREFNAGLLRLAERHARLAVIDMEPLAAAGGAAYEPRMSAYAKAHLGPELLSRYAREAAHLARALRGRAKKVLVLDLDNTLWDGVLGDDGAEGIAAAATFRGEAFGRFQQVVRQLAAQGVVLAVSSKNDDAPVREVLRGHPDMVLREGDFAQINANWLPKDGNIRQIAERLNLATDSFVFADDSAFETGLVADSLPEVAVVRLDDEPALHPEKLLADGWFDVPRLTEEDRARGGRYRTESARQDLLDTSASYGDYLDRLGLTVTVRRAAGRDLPRVSQLTLRTNQFNLTTVRMRQEDVERWAGDPDRLVLAVESADRFGDNGLVGAVFAHRTAGGLHIDNMVLSCRVFARGIEQAVLGDVLAHAAATGAGEVTAVFRPSRKNGKFRDFYPSVGFTPAQDDGPESRFRHDLAELPAVPGHLRLDSELSEGRAHAQPE
ncbi:HAD-IIIC family phosphatase [Streptomyces sp. P6-2-1]|uniref:HAD-IIIC family phosphatase n=1 Tax=Streptomyces sp. P6-2-1 TaxID=3422591 RepID=UPI003D35D790